jgi:uncharacterized protein YecE (DUF72 family)
MKKGKIYIGTSGWHYKHWKGKFYPADLKEDKQLQYYTAHFQTVEINNSFYRLPSISAFRSWKKQTPSGFIFAVKASRFITHMKKLKLDKAGLRIFFTRLAHLGNKTGPILFQLPPRWKVNSERFAEFLKQLSPKYRYAFEFRNETWYNEEIYSLLEKYNYAFCIYELERHISPMQVTADFIYIRLHGPGNKYQGSYSKLVLKKWATMCKKWIAQGKDIYIYFDNDQEAYAAFNASTLQKLINGVVVDASS